MKIASSLLSLTCLSALGTTLIATPCFAISQSVSGGLADQQESTRVAGIFGDAFEVFDEVDRRRREAAREAERRERHEAEMRRLEAIEAERSAAAERQQLEADRRQLQAERERLWFESLSPEDQTAYRQAQEERQAQQWETIGNGINILFGGGGGSTGSSEPSADSDVRYERVPTYTPPAPQPPHRPAPAISPFYE